MNYDGDIYELPEVKESVTMMEDVLDFLFPETEELIFA